MCRSGSVIRLHYTAELAIATARTVFSLEMRETLHVHPACYHDRKGLENVEMSLDSTTDALRDGLRLTVTFIEKNWRDLPDEDNVLWHDLLTAQCRLLHHQMTAAGHEPKHSTDMIRNRKTRKDGEDFYRHMHTAQDLLGLYGSARAAKK